MSTTLRAGIIGCGSMAGNHIRGYLDSGRYEIVALADLEEAAMAEPTSAVSCSPTPSPARAKSCSTLPNATSAVAQSMCSALWSCWSPYSSSQVTRRAACVAVATPPGDRHAMFEAAGQPTVDLTEIGRTG